MKSVVLDTNTLAMILTGDTRLPDQARRVIEDAPAVLVSAISFFEIGQKVRLGKWDEMRSLAPNLIDICMEDGFQVVPLSPLHALEASLLEWPHRDPFDGMIAAVARIEDAQLASSDAAFDQLSDVQRIWKA